ncbi:MAG: signal peptidase I [Myxococcales bacterium]|nr:signal peptidase I [Myxococcales bacterium]
MIVARACIAALWALVVPGAGHAYVGDLRTALTVMFLAPALGALVCLCTATGWIPPELFVPLALGAPGLVLVATAVSAAWSVVKGAETWNGSAVASFAFGSAFLTVGAMAIVHAEVLSLRRIASSSMLPLLEVGDYVLVRRGQFAPEALRGQILEFRFPRDRRFTYVQRVIGVGGEEVSMTGFVPEIDGAAFVWSEPGTGEWRGADCTVRTDDRATETPEGQSGYTVLGGQLDSKDKPLRLGSDELFMLSDNRSNADDSRRWGPLPRRDVSGQVFGIAMSWDPCEGRLRSQRAGALP